MKNPSLIVLALCISFYSVAQDKPILVTPSWLNEHLKDPGLVVLQVNTMEMDYSKEHIPGARFLWTGWLAPNTPQGAFNTPDAKSATDILQQLGVSNDSHIVLCHVLNEVTPTARMFLTLEHFGMRGRVSFLNGGLEGWKKAGYAVTAEVPPAAKKENSLRNQPTFSSTRIMS